MKKLLAVSAIAASVLVAITSQTTAANAAVRSHVSIKASKSAVLAGNPVVFSGTVSPASVQRPLRLELLVGRTWRNIANHSTNSRGVYSFSWVVANPGVHYYRVGVLANTHAASAVSAAVAVTARRWHYLYDLSSVDNSCCNSESTQINGPTYLRSIVDPNVSGTDEYIDFNLSRKCLQFAGTLGLVDNSSSNASAQLEIVVDGNTLFSQAYHLGQSTPVSLNINGHLRLRLNTSYLGGDQVNAGYGNARVLCTF